MAILGETMGTEDRFWPRRRRLNGWDSTDPLDMVGLGAGTVGATVVRSTLSSAFFHQSPNVTCGRRVYDLQADQ
jgi:hypothetical protein